MPVGLLPAASALLSAGVLLANDPLPPLAGFVRGPGICEVVPPGGVRTPCDRFDLVGTPFTRSDQPGCFVRLRSKDDERLYDQATCTEHCRPPAGPNEFRFAGCSIF